MFIVKAKRAKLTFTYRSIIWILNYIDMNAEENYGVTAIIFAFMYGHENVDTLLPTCGWKLMK